MRAIGLAVALPTSARPAVRAVLLNDGKSRNEVPTIADVTMVDEFDLTTAESEWARMASQFHQDISGRLATLKPDRVVVRGADAHHNRRLTLGVSLRLYVEGAVSAAALTHVAEVYFRTGAGCVAASGTDKAVLEAEAATLGAKSAHAEAVVAALSALYSQRG